MLDSRRRFSALAWLVIVNLGLVLLFFWALTEETTLRIEVVDGLCTALLNERTNLIPCPGLSGGQIGLYTLDDKGQDDLVSDPWQLIVPASRWQSLLVGSPNDLEANSLLNAGRPLRAAGISTVLHVATGESQPAALETTIVWPNPVSGDFQLEAGLRRPEDEAGVLLLEPEGNAGWLYLYDSATRLGTWWRWRDGQRAGAILGSPLQKSLTAQVQSLTRQVLIGHQAGLLLLLASWLLALILAWFARRLGRQSGSLPDADAATGRSGHPGRTRLSDRYVLIFLMLLVFGVSLFISVNLLGGLPHVQDSITYLFQAQTMARGQLTAPAPPLPEFFEQEFMLVEAGRWFGKYAPGYPLLLAPAVRSGLPWLVNPLLATMTLALLYVLGKAWYGRMVGMIVALLAAVSPFFLIMSGTYMAHPAELFWLTLFMVAWTRVVKSDAATPAGQSHAAKSEKGQSSISKLPWLIVAGAAIGMAFLTRQLSAVTIAGVFVLATTASQPRHVAWRRRLGSLLSLAIVILPFVLSLLAYQWSVTGDPLQDPRLLYWPYDHLGFGQDIGQGQNVVTFETVQGEQILVWQHDPEQPPRGHTPARGVFNVERNFRHLLSHLFGWLPAFSLAFAWIVFVSGNARRIDWVSLATAGALMIVYIFYWADGVAYGPRYLYAALPALLILVARGIQTTANWIGGRVGKWAVGLILAGFIAGAMLFYLPNVLTDLEDFNFISEARLAAVEAAIDEQALVFVAEENGDWWEYGNYFVGNSPWLDGRIIYARDQGPADNARLQAHFPERSPYLLQHGRLIPLDADDS